MSSNDSVQEEGRPAFQPVRNYVDVVNQMIPGRQVSLTMMRAIMTHALEQAEAQPHVLVVGAGGGEEIIQLAQDHPTWRFTGVDLNEDMINTGKQRIADLGLPNEVTWFQGPIDQLEATGFDAATCVLTAHFLPDNGERQQFYADIHRRMKPGATLVLVSGSYNVNGNPEGATGVERLLPEDRFNYELHFQHARLMGAPEDIITQQYNVVGKMGAIPDARERELLQTVGFSNIYQFFHAAIIKGWVAQA